MTLVSMTIQTNGAETWTAEVRKNNLATIEASLAAAAASGNTDNTKNKDFNAGDEVQCYMNTATTLVDRPVIGLEFAYRFS